MALSSSDTQKLISILKQYGNTSTPVASSGGGSSTTTTKTTTPVVAPATVATTSNTYNYVDSSGNVRQVSASSADEAMRKASNIGATSGVQLVSGGSSAPAPVTTTPGQTAVTSPTTSPTTTTSNVSNMTPTDFVQYLVSTGTIKAEDAARATSIATGQPDPTMMANIPGVTDIDNQIEKGEANLQALRDAASNESDEDIRQRITDLFQREIDALNALYAQQKSDATKAGLAQLGTNRASQARFGLLGSTFGEAETAGINQQTEQQKQDIDVRAQAALAPIYNQISTEILNARKAKETARLTSAEDYLANLRNKKETINTIAANAIRNILANKANPTDKDLNDMAKQIGVDPSTFKSDYKAAKKAEEEDIAEKATQKAGDLNKTINTDNGTFVSRDGGATWTPLAGSSKVATVDKVTPLSILDIQRYNEAYPEAGVSAGDTEATANAKVAASNSPETKTRNLILGAKDAGDTYETVLADIKNSGLFTDKEAATKIAQEIFGTANQTNNEIDTRASYFAKQNYSTGQIRESLVREGYSSSEAMRAANKANNEDAFNATINSIGNALFN